MFAGSIEGFGPGIARPAWARARPAQPEAHHPCGTPNTLLDRSERGQAEAVRGTYLKRFGIT